MKITARLRLQLLLQNGAFALLLVSLAALAVYLMKDSKQQWDLTRGQRNSLGEPSVKLLSRLGSPVSVVAYASAQDPQRGDLRKQIHDFLAPYQRVKRDITLSFVDPTEKPKETAAANIRMNGELVVSAGARSEHLTDLSEASFINLLQRLSRNQERQVVFLDGHGEPRLDGNANFDLGGFGHQLENKGFRVRSLNLTIAPEVPDNVSVLVLTQPRQDLFPGEVEKLRRYVDRGGSLLWLVEPEPLHGLQPLVAQLGLALTPGVVIDPASAKLGLSATIALGAQYGAHAITENFTNITAFPLTRRIAPDPDAKGWHATTLVEVAAQGWVEVDPLDKPAAFEKNREVPGPVGIALALERTVKEKTQRVVVVGGSSFLSNQYLGLVSNVDFGVNSMNWLSADENLITIAPRPRVDSELRLTRGSLTFIALGFLLLLPATFLLTGVGIWFQRRKG